MNRQVYNYIISNKLFSINKDKIILAISAGADSVCLFHIFRFLEVNMELAHCNFKLRNYHSDEDEVFINKQYADEKNLPNLSTQVYGWEEKYKKTLSEVFIAQENYGFEIVKITFSQNGFLTVEEKDLKTIFLGFNPNLINHQLRIINRLKNKFKKNNFSKKIDNIDLTNPQKPKIKVFKP